MKAKPESNGTQSPAHVAASPPLPNAQPIVVSACLAGIPCRFDGRAKPDPGIVKRVNLGTAIPVCPEQLGGLPTPRPPAEIVGGDGEDVLAGKARVYTNHGEDVTEAFISGATIAAQRVAATGVTEVVLKDRSPACGACEIYDGTHQGKTMEGLGVFAALLKRHGIEVSVR